MRGSGSPRGHESAPCSRRRSPGAAGRLRFAWPPLEAPSGRGGAGGCGGAGPTEGQLEQRACPPGGRGGAAEGGPTWTGRWT